MGRTNGKLSKFLKDGLQNETFKNLKWEDRDSQIFSIRIPRYDEKKERDLKIYEWVLFEWYNVNKRSDEYPGYSGAKSVIQAAMKKSPYLLSLVSKDKKRYFKFATKAEELEKRRLQKLKSKIKKRAKVDESYWQPTLEEHDDPNFLPKVSPPPSPPSSSSGYESGCPPSPSSGYQSGGDQDENIKMDYQMLENAEFLDDLFNDPDSYIDAMNDLGLDSGELSFSDIMGDSVDTVTDIKPNDVQCIKPENKNLFKPVEELIATEVHSSRILNTYWLCTKKVKFDSTLLLICEKQVIQDESLGFAPGQIYLNNVFEPGESYDFKNMIELDGKCFLFLSKNC